MEHSPYTRHLLAQAVRFSKMQHRGHANWDISLGDMAVGFLLEQARLETGEAQVRMSDISNRLGVSRPAATQIVARLCSRGILERAPDPKDRRSTFVRPTPKAQLPMRQGMERALTLTDRVIEDLGEQDAKELIRLLDRLHESIHTRVLEEEKS